MSTKKIDISVVVPVYKEEGIIREFYQKLIQTMEQIELAFEIIFINDDQPGSETLQILKNIQLTDSRVIIISFSRNFGHQIALTAGIDYALGDAVVMLDSDLQHPPEMIATLVHYWKQGYDIVYTIRKDVEGETIIKKLFSSLFYFIMSKISDIEMGVNCADFRLLDRKVVESVKKIRERSRFMRGLVSWVGYKKIGIPFVGLIRGSGKSKYNFSKSLKFALDGILSFSIFPIRMISGIGFLVSLLSFLYIVRVFYFIGFTKEAIPDWQPITTILLFASGIQMLMLGVLGEYIAKIFTETKNRPLYLIDEIICDKDKEHFNV